MPLSDRERKLLAEMEEALSADDPRLSSTLTGTRLVPGRNKMLAGGLALVAGLATIFAGLISQVVPIGIVGFIIALSGLLTVLSGASGVARVMKSGQGRKRGSNTFGSRLEERWDRRNFE
ncbi:MAG: DUF3040 domain-containing protein [Actinobacteria bacterium]|nr:DUF3040 domain-containing protein [Actinomycetota bacterium]